MFVSVHNATQDASQPVLLLNYTHGCIGDCSCDESTLLDYGDSKGSWRVDIASNPLFAASPGGIYGAIAGTGFIALILLTILLIPFCTFRPPKELEEGDIIDTALCFHINMFNQKPWVEYFKMVMVALISISDLVMIFTMSDTQLMLQVLLFPLILSYVAILFMYPYAKYNQMDYDDFIAVFKADGHFAGVADMKPHHIFLKLIVHNSQLRVLDEVSRQAMADMQTAGIVAKAPPQTIAPPQQTEEAVVWAASSAKVMPAPE